MKLKVALILFCLLLFDRDSKMCFYERKEIAKVFIGCFFLEEKNNKFSIVSRIHFHFFLLIDFIGFFLILRFLKLFR